MLLRQACLPLPRLGLRAFFAVNARARHWIGCYGLRSARMACAKIGALGQLEAKYSRMRRVLRVTTAASFSSLVWMDFPAILAQLSLDSRT
jgi:hypothetical protein